MRSKVKIIEPCTTLFEIDVPKETVTEAFAEVYAEIAKVAQIPGFRAGKAPLDLVKKRHGADAREEVLKRLVPDAYRKALEEHKVDPLGLPDVSDVDFDEGKALLFKATVATKPKFTLKKYTGIAIKKKKAALDQADVAKTIENLRGINAKYDPIEDRPVQMGDYVVSDLECFVDGKPAHKKRENLWLAVEAESLIPGLNEKMVGMTRGEEREIDVVLPEKYPDKSIAGKKALYRVKAKEIKVRRLPALDDEFAKDLGKVDLAELRKAIATELEQRMAADSDIDVENQLLKKLIDDNAFPVPQGLVARQTELMVHDAHERLMAKGFKKEDLAKRDGEFAAKFKEDAARHVRLMFILDAIASAEHIEPQPADLEKAFGSIAERASQPVEKVRAYYEKEGLVENLTEKIREEKTIRWLLDHAKIAEAGS